MSFEECKMTINLKKIEKGVEGLNHLHCGMQRKKCKWQITFYSVIFFFKLYLCYLKFLQYVSA
jgi:hypothetical protein